ncbi:MAG: hypothetical protein EZS28_028218 [Streblomastix strix]|uniref:Uncharacterized protein n=1 Tax=Streblomastix strix TaxID=222440 RepID=A0A5J4V0Y1_9EUKA|nr:MAG: hypothetical protein EZS28_028218 [Streblomastix strix]
MQTTKRTSKQNTIVEALTSTRPVGQLIGLQPLTSAENPSLNAALKKGQAGLISARNREKTDPKINERKDDNSEKKVKLMKHHQSKKKIYRIHTIIQTSIKEYLPSKFQPNWSLNALSEMEKDDSGSAPVGVLGKPKQGKGKRKSKTEGLNASDDQSQSSNAQAQTQIASAVPKPKATLKKGTKNPNRLNPNQKLQRLG